MAKRLEPPKFTRPLVKPNSFLSEEWAAWILQLYAKIQELEARVKDLETP